MADYLHGAYGEIQAVGTKVAIKSRNAIVYVGTAPVHTVSGGAENVNKPILVNNIAEARKYFGYSDEWDKFSLCEAMHAHLESKAVAPLVLINVLDPAKHKTSEASTTSLTPENGRVTIANAGDIILDTVAVTGKTKGTDYAVQYDFKKKMLTIAELSGGSLGTEKLTITYSSIDAAAVKEDDVIGSSDGAGLNTGIFAIGSLFLRGTLEANFVGEGVNIFYFLFVGLIGINFLVEFSVNMIAAAALCRVVRVVEKHIFTQEG